MIQDSLVTLTTDFGLEDPYVGQMKGAILKQNMHARIIDLTHAIPAHDILAAAITICSSYRYFPVGTTHLVVVDPGVGSLRRILAASGDGHRFIAPDNGIFTLLLRDSIIDTVHLVENRSLYPREISATFHGRDIMAPVAAALSGGMELDQVGPAIDPARCVLLDLPEPVIKDSSITGQVLHIDRFGNVRTTITTTSLSRFQPGAFAGIEIQGRRINTISSTYSDVPEGELLALIDSSGYLEVAVNKGHAGRELDCRPGAPVIVSYRK
ncbi:SAM hydrolase/SAM-dependent halogenase family protein [Desulfolithobacter sp.]